MSAEATNASSVITAGGTLISFVDALNWDRREFSAPVTHFEYN